MLKTEDIDMKLKWLIIGILTDVVLWLWAIGLI
jgi:hypothetical protein